MTTSSATVCKEIKPHGYLSFEAVRGRPLICVLRGDESVIAVESRAEKILGVGSGPAGITHSNSVVTYTSRKVREGAPLGPEQDLEFDTVQEGEFVYRVENGAVVTLVPVVVQVDRAGVRLPGGEERYEVTSVAKVRVEGGP